MRPPGRTHRLVFLTIIFAFGLSFVQLFFNFNLVTLDDRGNDSLLPAIPDYLQHNATTKREEKVQLSKALPTHVVDPNDNSMVSRKDGIKKPSYNATRMNFSQNTSRPPPFLLSVPFFVYEDLVCRRATWDGKPLSELIDGAQPKHTDDYWFMRAALEHPMRTTNASEARLFVIPILQNIFDSRAFFKKKNLCCRGLCNAKLMSQAGQLVRNSTYFQEFPEAHLVVASHFAHHKKWWASRIPSSLQAVLWDTHNIAFEDYKANSQNRLSLPKMHVAKPCPVSLHGYQNNNKSHDVVLVASLKPDDSRFRDRETICSWLKRVNSTEGNHTGITADDGALRVGACGWGERCPTLADSKFGFHVRGDTPGSSRLFDTILSGTVPIFTLKKQYSVIPNWIDWNQISYFIDLETTTSAEEFHEKLKAILQDEAGYQLKLQTLLAHRHLFDWRTLYPFDMYLYTLQLHLYPETRHSLPPYYHIGTSSDVKDHLPLLHWPPVPSSTLEASENNYSGGLAMRRNDHIFDFCNATLRCHSIPLKSAKFSYVHISKNSGVSWIRELKKLKQVEKDRWVSKLSAVKNFNKTGLYPIAESGAEHGVKFQDHLLNDHQPFLRLTTLRSPRHQIWSMFSHCYYSEWGKKATANNFPRDHPENDVLDFELWLDRFLDKPGNSLLLTPDQFPLKCYHPQNYQSRALVSEKETPRQPDGLYSPDIVKVKRVYWSLDWVSLTAFFHESKCILYDRLDTDDIQPELAVLVRDYVMQTCRCDRDDMLPGATKSKFADINMTHANEGHRSTMLDVPSRILRKIDIISQVDIKLYKTALEQFIQEIVRLEAGLKRRVFCDGVLEKWADELNYIGTNLTSMYWGMRHRFLTA